MLACFLHVALPSPVCLNFPRSVPTSTSLSAPLDTLFALCLRPSGSFWPPLALLWATLELHFVSFRCQGAPVGQKSSDPSLQSSDPSLQPSIRLPPGVPQTPQNPSETFLRCPQVPHKIPTWRQTGPLFSLLTPFDFIGSAALGRRPITIHRLRYGVCNRRKSKLCTQCGHSPSCLAVSFARECNLSEWTTQI